ncbi:hypothetical protein [Algibacter sp. PT7-4]|uniref:hypothetical protein n=1 Tax=Algibacter ulvanivorans TaxID=3400999 RepID=UPI003AABC3A4
MNFVKKPFFILAITLCFINMQCHEDDGIPYQGNCDEVAVVDSNLYKSISSENVTLINAEVVDNCLNIKIGASGCDGNTWAFKLVDSGVVAESSPEQRYLKLQLINNEACLAYFEKYISFDLTPLQINGSNKIILHIDGLEMSLTYNY